MAEIERVNRCAQCGSGGGEECPVCGFKTEAWVRHSDHLAEVEWWKKEARVWREAAEGHLADSAIKDEEIERLKGERNAAFVREGELMGESDNERDRATAAEQALPAELERQKAEYDRIRRGDNDRIWEMDAWIEDEPERTAAELEAMAEDLKRFQADEGEAWTEYDQGLLRAQTRLRERAAELRSDA